jgi:hypothetical protein
MGQLTKCAYAFRRVRSGRSDWVTARPKSGKESATNRKQPLTVWKLSFALTRGAHGFLNNTVEVGRHALIGAFSPIRRKAERKRSNSSLSADSSPLRSSNAKVGSQNLLPQALGGVAQGDNVLAICATLIVIKPCKLAQLFMSVIFSSLVRRGRLRIA